MVADKSAELESNPQEEEASDEELVRLNLVNGKKNLLCGDYPEAVACFQTASSIQSEKHGDTSPECAEVFYYYGRSLLELARVENGVLGNALKGVPETEDSSDSETEEPQFEKTKNLPATERDQLRQEVEAAMATETEDNNDTQDEDEEAKADGEKDKETKTADEEKMETDGQQGKEQPSEDKEKEKPAEEEGDKEKASEELKGDAPDAAAKPDEAKNTETENTEDPDDIPNMQLAWEMLELAKFLYQKKPKSEETNLCLAQCHQKLGELGLEVENYSQAVGDFLECLVIQKDALQNYDRRLAETHYNLGLAYSFHKRFDNSLEHYNAALGVLEARIEFLNEEINENDRKKEKTEETIEECAEIGEINELIPDINSKIEDVMQMKKNEGKMAGSPFAKASAQTSGETSSGFATSSDRVCTVIPIRKPASGSATTETESASSTNDISHLVRRKRAAPDDESTAAQTSPSKKIRQEDTSNGDQGSKPETNGNKGNGTEEEKNASKSVAELKELNKQESNGTPVAMEN